MLALVAAAFALAARQLLDARTLAVDAAARLVEVEAAVGPEDLLSGDVGAEIAGAAQDLDRAHAKLSSVWLVPFRPLPVVGRQIRAFDAQVAALRDGSDIAASAIGRISARFDTELATPEDRIDALAFLAAQSREMRAKLQGVDAGPADALISPLRSSRRDLAQQLDRLDGSLAALASGADALGDLLRGPTSLLLIAANNAEMRAGSGMFLQAGELRLEGGRAELLDMRPTADLEVPAAVAPPLPESMKELWAWANPNQEWRNLAMTPRFPESAALAAQMWEALGNAPVDGVIVVDPAALEAILKATGTVAVGDQAVAADDVVDVLTRRQYEDFDEEDQPERRERLAAFAKTAFERLNAAEVDVEMLAESGRRAARGRHVLAWSPDAELQGAFEDLGVAGDLSPDSLMISLLNAGGSKLDRHVEVSGRFDVSADESGTRVDLDIEIRNDAKPTLPEFVLGPYARLGLEPGAYLANLAVSLPAAAYEVDLGPDASFDAAEDGQNRVVVLPLRVELGESARIQVSFRLPAAGGGEVRIESSARIPAIQWSAGGEEWRDFRARRLTWSQDGNLQLAT